VKRVLLALVASLSLTGAAPRRINWVNTVTMEPSGAYVMGDPKAKVRLVEYLSYTCPHCAHFTDESAVPIKRDYVAKGLVSVEVRHAVRDSYDFAATLVARCGGAAKFFGTTEIIMAAQPQWTAKAQGFAASDGERVAKLSMNDGLKAIARGLGFDVMLTARRIKPAQMDVCLSDAKVQQIVGNMAKEAWEVRKIPGTPAFLINGQGTITTISWAGMEPQLKTALGIK
jgi:protein-disulfide isomerase